jgi:hypothetical protein
MVKFFVYILAQNRVGPTFNSQMRVTVKGFSK